MRFTAWPTHLGDGKKGKGKKKKKLNFSPKVFIKLIFQVHNRLSRVCCILRLILLREWQIVIGVGDTDLQM